ncbi:glycoside hydrolase family 9 protein [Catellatospora paridis]|uniref:glycoside hydrolase family 9 protein n=1 Tax=Catellatospora paridis TaxID=1617086 RepID=UPI0012D3A444|nr:glycoside hydrolase family 9 protein [Catellatospora paridis]
MPAKADAAPAVLVAHLGYGLRAAKAAIAVLPDGAAPQRVELLAEDGTPQPPLAASPVQTVSGWTAGPFARIDLPPDLGSGSYRIRIRDAAGREATSHVFEIAADRLQRQTMSDVLAYFRAMRSSGEMDRKDRHAALWGDDSGRTIDARGGWLDASGDTSKFLSHLTYTRTMSPQQTPLCAWAMMAARDALAERHPALLRSLGARLRDEALWGADFLVRFRAPEGYFYTGIFDALTKRLDERVITAPLAECVRTDRYQAGYRQGGGLAIAALARAATLDDDGDFSRADYLSAALHGFAHLEEHNLDHLDDHAENIVDDYCALLAAAELVAAGAGDGSVRAAAGRRAASLLARYVRPQDQGPGWFLADAQGRPFFHAVEAGLPMLALLRFAHLLPEAPQAAAARALALEATLDTLRRSQAVPNPFGYPRQRVQPADADATDAFFFPHANETGYWWQGENATIASLAAAAAACADLDGVTDGEREQLAAFADDQVAWITGRNPFDVSMIQGRGHNNVDYESDFPNLPGGIVNGITAGWSDEADIAFLPSGAPAGDSWRWAEQWIPHAGWFLLAAACAR